MPVRTLSSSWVKVPRVIAMSGFLSVVRRDRPRRCLGLGDRTGAAVTASQRAAELQWRTGEAGKFDSAAAARRRALLPAGEILPADRLAAARTASRALRDMPGTGLRKRRQGPGGASQRHPNPALRVALADVGLGSKTKPDCHVPHPTGIKASGTLETRARKRKPRMQSLASAPGDEAKSREVERVDRAFYAAVSALWAGRRLGSPAARRHR